MRAEERREKLWAFVRAAKRPVAGIALAERFGVSRQIIVQDVSVLRAAGCPIIATPRGYLTVPVPERDHFEAVVAVRHGREESAAELTALVDAGVRVVDVVVEHPLYGDLRGSLHLESRADVEEWLVRVSAANVHLLSELTDGVHLHTIQASRPEALDRARSALDAMGLLVGDRS